MATAIEVKTKSFNSLREWMSLLDDKGLLHRIDAPVSKDEEVGAICREVFDKDGPALLFNKVGNHRTPLFVGGVATRERYSLALGVEPNVHAIATKWAHAYKNPIKYEKVSRSEAPCKEVVIDNPDLYADPFPVPKWHHLDAGPELATLHGVITMDPDTGWINVGNYRGQIFNSKQFGCYLVSIPVRHAKIHWDKWKAMGKPMPVCVALGMDPYLHLTSVSAVPYGVDEYDVAGGLRGSPTQVVKAELSDLLVPSQAEIIIEGYMPTDKLWPEEAPFGEFPGYMGQTVKNCNFIEVHKVTHRKSPIFQGTYEGRPPSESTMVRSMGRSAALWEHLRRAGLVGIKDVSVTPAGCAGFHANVSIKKSYHGHVRDVMFHVWGHPNLFCKHVTVVDEDIDPWNPFMVEWAIATRVQACRDVITLSGAKSIDVDPSQVGSRRGESDLLGIDATKPLEEYARDGSEYPAGTDPLPETMEKVRKRWKEYGFKD